MSRNLKLKIALLLTFSLLLTVNLINVPVSYAATINITSYGATPNDGTDDTVAIQNAINAASPGDTVYIPNGTFNVTNVINAKSNVNIQGQSQSGAILKFTGGSARSAIILCNGKSNITISALTIDGNNSPHPNAGIRAENSSYITVKNCTIKNFANTTDWGPFGVLFRGGDGYSSPGVTYSEVSDCTFQNIGVNSAWGTAVRLAWGSSYNKILRNNVSNTGRGGILVNDGCTDLVIKDNVVSGTGLDGGDDGLGIEIWNGCHRSVIEDNTTDRWISIDSSHHCAVRRNTIGPASSPIQFCALENAGDSYDNVFTDNVIDGGHQIGISVSNDGNKHYLYYGHNVVKNMIQWGAQIQGDQGGAKYIYFKNCEFLYTKNNDSRAIYPNDDGHGFRINGNSDYITLDNCKINNNMSLGVQPMGVDHISFTGGEIRNNGGNAFQSYSGYTAFEISGVTVSGNSNNSTPAPKPFNNQKPVAVISGPSSGSVGQTLNFNSNSSYDPDGSISHVLWDFDDGIPSTSAITSHIFNSPGTYRVTLIVWDNYGRGAVAEKYVTIGGSSEPTPTPSPGLTNVALGKTATADSTYGIEVPGRTVDGSLSTKWASNNNDVPHWVRIDLGKEYTISKWVVKHAQAGGEASYFNTRDFKLQRSSNGTNWIDVDSVTGSNTSVTDRNVTPFTARYVRLYITEPTNFADNTARIYEFEVWGY